MIAKGEFIDKSIEDRARGSFTNKETGEVIEYNACKVLVVDEITENGKFKERRFKLSNDNTGLINEFGILEPYTKVEIEFDVAIYSSNAKITPVSFEVI